MNLKFIRKLDKRGYQFLESSIVSPLFIIIGICMVLLIIFYMNCLFALCNDQENLLEERKNSVVGVNVNKREQSVNMKIAVFDNIGIEKMISQRCYVFDYSILTMNGNLIDDFIGKKYK